MEMETGLSDFVVETSFEECPLTDSIPQSIRDREQMELSGWRTAEGFSLETHVTSRNVLANILRHVWPPVIPCCKGMLDCIQIYEDLVSP